MGAVVDMAVTVDESGPEGKGSARSLGGFTYVANAGRAALGTLDGNCAFLC